jgi:hypothetical protein
MAGRKPKRWDLVEVVWLDAFIKYEEMSVSEALALNPPSRKTLGYFLAQTAEKLTIAGTDDRADNKDTVAEVTVIPSPWLAEISVLTRAQ